MYNTSDIQALRGIYDTLDFNIKNLKQLDVDVETYGSLLIAIILERIPEEIRIKISLHFGENEWNLGETLDVLKTQIEARERSLIVSGLLDNGTLFSTHGLYTGISNDHGRKNSRGNRRNGKSLNRHQNQNNNREFIDNTSSTNRDNPSNRSTGCIFCGENHLSSRCRNVTDVSARYNIVKRDSLCFVCFKKHHRASECRLNYNCIRCGRKHNIALCTQRDERRQPVDPARSNNGQLENNHSATRPLTSIVHVEEIRNNANSSAISTDSTCANVNLGECTAPDSKVILLQSALADVCNPDEKNSSKTCALFDGGSHRTYITTELRDKLKLVTIRQERLIVNTFASREGRLQTLNVVQVCIKARNGYHVYVEALCVPYICAQLKSPSFDFVRNRYQYLCDVELADPPSDNHKIEILIGLDYYFSLITGRTIRSFPGTPVAVESVLGWIVCGPVSTQASENQSVMANVVCVENFEGFDSEADLKGQLKKFWEVESVPMADINDSVLDKFNENIYFDGERYIASLPFKPDVKFVPDNYSMCYR